MSETADFDPGHWKGHDFSRARKKYDTHVGRSYGDAKKAKKTTKDVLPDALSTKSPAPLVVLCDVTGSMGDWPATIFSKLPYLELEGQEYLGKKMEISFGAIGDAQAGDDYPIQACQFTKGTKLKDELEKLVVVGRGGANAVESYELACLYYARNVNMPNAIRPICIIIGDEGFYDTISKSDAKAYAKVDIQSRLRSSQMFDELMTKYSVYLIRKPYNCHPRGDEPMTGQNKRIHEQWEKVLGADRVLMLPDASRVVDVIFGILARETDRIDYFRDELKGRQKPGQIKTVMKSLETVHTLAGGGADSPKLLASGKSVMHKGTKGKKTKSLL